MLEVLVGQWWRTWVNWLVARVTTVGSESSWRNTHCSLAPSEYQVVTALVHRSDRCPELAV